MSKAHTGATDKSVTDTVEVSTHASLRYLERVEATEPLPAERVRETVSDGTRVEVEGFDLPVYLNREAAVLVDERNSVAVTVVEATSVRQDVSFERDVSGAHGTDASAGWREEAVHQGVPPGGHR